MKFGNTEILSKFTSPFTTKLQDNIMLNAFRVAVNGSLTQFNMLDGIVDEYEDESGITPEEVAPFCHMALEDNTDDGTGANAVTNIGTPTYTSGKLNNALTLDGSTDALNIDALVSDIKNNTSGSFSVWINPNSGGNTFIGFGDTNAETYLRIGITSGSDLIVQTVVTGSEKWRHSSSITLSTWSHIIVVQNGTSPKIYVNGIDVTNLTVTSDLTVWLNNMSGIDNGRLGCYNQNSAGNTGFFNGLIDDFRYYQNHSLSSTEITYLYNSGTGTESSVQEGSSENISYDSTDDYYSPDKPQVSVSPFTHLKCENSTDDGTGANSFTNIGTPTYTSGKINNALTLDGTTDALNADAMLVDISSDTTGSFAFWTKPNDGEFSFCITFGDTDGYAYFRMQLQAYDISGDVVFSIGDNSTDIMNIRTDGAVVTDNGWHHIVITQDGSGIKVYVDGNNVSYTDTYSNPTSWLADAIGLDNGRIGCTNRNSSGNTSFFGGQLDDIRYYSGYVLSQTEVALLYNSGTGTHDNQPEGDAENMELISEDFTAEAQPDSGRIVLLEEDVDSITLNTDLKAYASRDGGTSWVQGTLADEGDYDTDKRILVADFDFTASGVGTGTDMKYKIDTANNKDVKLHATSLNWD